MMVNLQKMSDVVQTNGHLLDGFVPRVEGKHVGVVVTSCRVGLNKVILSVLFFGRMKLNFWTNGSHQNLMITSCT